MICGAQTHKEVVAVIVRNAVAAQEIILTGLVTLVIHAVAPRATFIMPHAKADAAIKVPFGVGIVDVERGIAAATGVGTYLGTAEVSTATILLQHYIDDAGGAFGRIFGRRIGDDLYALNALAGYLFKNLCAVIGGET